MSGGWITWAGGECPVPPETKVDIRSNRGVEECGVRAFVYRWSHSQIGGAHNIIAYRIHEAEPAEPAGAGVAVPAGWPDELHIIRLLDAIEGECDGIALSRDIARNILVYVMTGEPYLPPAQDGTAS